MTISSFQILPKKVLMYFLLVMSLILLSNCSTTSQEEGPTDDSDLVLLDEGSTEESPPALEAESTRSGFDQFDESSTDQAASTSEDDLLIDNEATQQKVAETQAPVQDPSAAAAEDEFAQFDEASTVDTGAPLGEGAPLAEKAMDTLSSGEPEPVPSESLSQPDQIAQNDPPMPQADPNLNQTFKSKNQNIQITDLQYKGNDAGGTFVIDGSGPMEYTVNKNERLNQFIIDIPYAKLPKKLQRTFNTKDFQGSIGQIDAFESSENSARIVVQLRPGATEPMVQREGSSLLLISSNYGGPRNDYSDKNEFTLRTGVDSGPAVLGASGANDQTVGEAQLLEGTSSLRDFLSNNTQFYGKKITLETSTMQVKDALRFIMEDIGVNMVISDKVDGPLSLKLRQVPWDQALSLILKVKGLGFIRQGSVLRIMTMDELKAEEEAAVSSDRTQKALEPLQVKMFRVSYAQAASIADRLKQFSTERRGKIEADVPTNAIVVTDIPEVLERMEKILKTLDTQPPQVLIEGKIVEASEGFSRTLGVSWGFQGQSVNVANGKQGPVTLTPRLNILPGGSNVPGTFNLGVNVGVL
ncbi:MAG: secretin N-terminal domain-containing protein, partial [Pseudobdellovibrionaceae bacterium]